MKFPSIIAAAAILAMITGCMRNERQANSLQGAAMTDTSVGTAQATATPTATLPPEANRPLNNVERADQLIGQAVLTSDHQQVGKIDDFVIDQDSGKILYAIIGIGGVLGVGETRVAVPTALFTNARKGSVQINVDKHKLTRAPQLTKDVEQKPTADFLGKSYGYFGQKAWWQEPSSIAAAFSMARKASDLKGMTIQNNAHQDIGSIESVVLDVPAGREMYVVISPSTDMALGNNYYALPPGAVKFAPDGKKLVADITRQKLADAPHFAKDDWSELSNTAWSQRVYGYYGQPTAFPNGELQPTGRTNQNTQVYPQR